MNRNSVIDLLKFLFILIIVLYHGHNFAGEEDFIFQGGANFVEFFFIVSGYLMASSGDRRTQKLQTISVGDESATFMWHKVKGLMPDLIVAWIIAFSVAAFVNEFDSREIASHAFRGIFDFLLLSQSGLKGFRPNAVTWYISAMLISMAILYPLMMKYKDVFFKVLAPLIALLLYGYMFSSFNMGLGGPSIWVGIAAKGLLRGLAGVSLGCVSYMACKRLKTINPTFLLSSIITLVEWGCYFVVCYIAFYKPHSKIDFYLVLFLTVGVTLTFSRKGNLTNRLADLKLFSWLGVFSLDLFLSHGFWSNVMDRLFPEESYWGIMPYYLVICFATALVVMGISTLIRKGTPVWRKAKPLFIVSADITAAEHYDEKRGNR